MATQHRSLSDLEKLVDALVTSLIAGDERYVLGVTGPPGAGKSTVAARIVARARRTVPACVAPMDGFHRSNEELEAAGLLPLKGVPDTFDATSFVEHLAALRERRREPVLWPTFDRSRECVVPAGSTIAPQHRLVVVEGNYLLLDSPPWHGVQPLLDAVWYLDVPVEVLVPRLQSRHERDRVPHAAAAKVASTDLPNAALVAATKHRADVILS